MSFFVLRTGALDDNQAATPLIGATPADISGFSTASAHVSLYVRHAAAHPATYRAANGDAIAAFGSLLYRGEASPAALPALLDHFDSGTFDWQGLLGSHVILIQKAQRLYAFCDGLGANKLYRNASGTLWSNSFLALCELAGPTTLDRQGCYEYVFNGAVFGSRTLVDGIRTLPANAILAVDRDSARVDQGPVRSATRHSTVSTPSTPSLTTMSRNSSRCSNRSHATTVNSCASRSRADSTRA